MVSDLYRFHMQKRNTLNDAIASIQGLSMEYMVGSDRTQAYLTTELSRMMMHAMRRNFVVKRLPEIEDECIAVHHRVVNE